MSRSFDLDSLRDSGTRLEGFLSIDVDSLIRKITSQSFRSPHHYPVELVRWALERGAGRVDVSIDRTTVTIRDDGGAVDAGSMTELGRVFDEDLPAAERQASLSTFETARGIGLLSALAPSPSLVEIRTGDRSLTIEGKVARARQLQGAPSSTRVRIHRKGGDPAAEREALADWCRFATGTVTVDGRVVSRHGVPGDALASAPVQSASARGTVWIPAKGDVCRLWLLDHGVRWREAIRPPVTGLVLEAAVECDEAALPSCWDAVVEVARGLYPGLASRHPSSTGATRERIEELLFLHHRRTLDASLVDSIRPFAVMGDGPALSLSEVRSAVARGGLKAIKAGDDPARYQTRGITVLVLDAQQWEFVVEHAHVPLSAPPPVPRPGSPTRRLVRWISRRWDRWVDGLRAAWVRPVDPSDLDPALGALVATLTREMKAGSVVFPDAHIEDPPAVVVSSRGGSRPGRLVQIDERTVLVLYAGHPGLADAARALERDRANLALVFPMLTAGRAILRDP